MSRPTKLTDEMALEIAGHLQLGNSIADSCAIVGVSEATYHNWVKRGEAGESPFFEFLELTRAARAQALAELARVVQTAALEGDWKAAAWKLERMDRATWGRTVDVKAEHSGELTIRVEYDDAIGHDQAPPSAPGPAVDPLGPEAV